nr:hypothetical protein [Tanacetum cinerariifolium]
MPTKIELTLEQSQQGVSNDVLVSIEGVEELNKAAIQTLLGGSLLQPPSTKTKCAQIESSANKRSIINLIEHPSDTKVFTMKMEILLEPTSNKLLVGTLPMLQPRSSEVKIHNIKLSMANHCLGRLLVPRNHKSNSNVKQGS